jgi:hypothetical protein
VGALEVGLVLGLLAAVACLAWWAWRRGHSPPEPAPVVGLALSAAGAVGIALTATTRPPGTLLPGLVALALAGAALRRGGRASLTVGVALLSGGAALVGWSLVEEGGAWLGVSAGLATCVAGVLLDDFDRRRRDEALAPVLLLVSVAGIYATVPDVEAAVAVVGAAVPMALLGWPGPLGWPRAAPPPSLGAGAFATAGLLVWIVAAGGSGRPGSVVGGLACLGVLAVDPVTHRFTRGAAGGRPLPGPTSGTREAGGASPPGPPGGARGAGSARTRQRLGVVVAQVVLVGVAARVVGRPTSAAGALVLLALEVAAIVAAVVALDRLRAARDRSPPGGDEIASG